MLFKLSNEIISENIQVWDVFVSSEKSPLQFQVTQSTLGSHYDESESKLYLQAA